MPAARRVEQKLLKDRGIVADLRRPPDHDLEDLLLLVEAADLEARHQRGRRAAHVTGLDAVPLGRPEIDLDRQLGLLGALLDVGRLQAVDAAEGGHDLLGLLAQHAELGTIDADRHPILVRRCQHVLEPRRREGQDLGARARDSDSTTAWIAAVVAS